jgi:hypothetical protein
MEASVRLARQRRRRRAAVKVAGAKSYRNPFECVSIDQFEEIIAVLGDKSPNRVSRCSGAGNALCPVINN